MNCNEAQSIMLDYLYGELKPRRQREFGKHLQACRKCSEELAAHKATISTFKELRMEEPPLGISKRVAAVAAEEIERRKPERASTRWYWKPALAAAATGALVIVSVVYYLPMATRDQGAPPMTMEMKRAPSPRAGTLSKDREAAEEVVVVGRQEGLSERPGAARADFEGAAYEGKNGMMAYKVESELKLEAAPDALEDRALLGEKAKEEARYPTRGLYAPPPQAKSVPSTLALPRTDSAAPKPPLDFSLPATMDGDVAPDSIGAIAGAVGPQEIPSDSKEMLKEKLEYVPYESWGARESKDQRAREGFAKGNRYFNERRFRQAAAMYQHVITLEPVAELAAEALYKLGRSYQELDMCEKALSLYNEVIREHPDFPSMGDVHIAAGECYLAIGRTEDALHNFEIARDHFPAQREVAIRKIDETVSQGKATEKSDQPLPPSAE